MRGGQPQTGPGEPSRARGSTPSPARQAAQPAVTAARAGSPRSSPSGLGGGCSSVLGVRDQEGSWRNFVPAAPSPPPGLPRASTSSRAGWGEAVMSGSSSNFAPGVLYLYPGEPPVLGPSSGLLRGRPSAGGSAASWSAPASPSRPQCGIYTGDSRPRTPCRAESCLPGGRRAVTCGCHGRCPPTTRCHVFLVNPFRGERRPRTPLPRGHRAAARDPSAPTTSRTGPPAGPSLRGLKVLVRLTWSEHVDTRARWLSRLQWPRDGADPTSLRPAAGRPQARVPRLGLTACL